MKIRGDENVTETISPQAVSIRQRTFAVTHVLGTNRRSERVRRSSTLATTIGIQTARIGVLNQVAKDIIAYIGLC